MSHGAVLVESEHVKKKKKTKLQDAFSLKIVVAGVLAAGHDNDGRGDQCFLSPSPTQNFSLKETHTDSLPE